MIAALTTEGNIVNLEEYGDFHIEAHAVMEGQFQVKAYPSRAAASTIAINLGDYYVWLTLKSGEITACYRGTLDECKAQYEKMKKEICESVAQS